MHVVLAHLQRGSVRVAVGDRVAPGTHDYTVSYPLAKAYFDRLEAPVKGFYTFERSAHSPLFEEPRRMREILIADVLTGSARLADPSASRRDDQPVL